MPGLCVERLRPNGSRHVYHNRHCASDGSHYEKRGDGEPVCIDDEIPFEIPESWAWCRFGMLCKKLTDGSHNPPPKQPSGYPVISAMNIKDGRIDLTLAQRFTDEKGFEKENPRTRISRGNIILGIIGGSIGNAAVYDHDVEVIAQRSIAVIDTFDLNDYCYWAIQSPLFFSYYSSASGTAQGGVYLGSISEMLIPVPPTQEQERIISQIIDLLPLINQYGTLEDTRERLDAELSDRLRKSILQLAVQGKLVEQNSADEPASALLDRIRAERAKLVKAGKLKAPKGGESVIYRASDGGYYEKRGKDEPVCIDDEIPFEIPESWSWARIKDFGFFSSGKTPSKHDQSLYGGDHLWVTSKDMKSFKIVQTGITLSDKGSESLNTYPVGTMLFVVRSGILKRFLPIAILDKPATINQDIKALALYLPSVAVGLAYFIKAFEPYILEELTKSVTTVDSLRFDEFQDMLIPVPPEAEWNRIIAQLDIALGEVITNQ